MNMNLGKNKKNKKDLILSVLLLVGLILTGVLTIKSDNFFSMGLFAVLFLNFLVVIVLVSGADK